MNTIYKNEAQATFIAFGDHIASLTHQANQEFGEDKWMLTFEFEGNFFNLKSAELISTLIIFRGVLEESQFQIAQHYSALKYKAFVIPDKTSSSDKKGSNIVTLITKAKKTKL